MQDPVITRACHYGVEDEPPECVCGRKVNELWDGLCADCMKANQNEREDE